MCKINKPKNARTHTRVLCIYIRKAQRVSSRSTYPPKLSKRMSASSTPSEWSRSRTVFAIIGGPQGGLMSEPYKITDTALVPTTPIGDHSVFSFDENTTINPDNKTITNVLYSGMCEWGTYCYQFNEDGNLYLLYNVDSHLNQTKDSIISDTTFYR